MQIRPTLIADLRLFTEQSLNNRFIAVRSIHVFSPKHCLSSNHSSKGAYFEHKQAGLRYDGCKSM